MKIEWKLVLTVLIALAAWSIVGPMVAKFTDKLKPATSTGDLENYA